MINLSTMEKIVTMMKIVVHLQNALVLVDNFFLKNPKKREYRMISNSLSKFVQVYEKFIKLRETNENARMTTLVAAINNFASASAYQDSIHVDPEVTILEEKKRKGFL